jgi:hypothetical protein
MQHVSAFWLCALVGTALASSAAAAGDLEFSGFPFPIPFDGLVEGTAPAALAPLPVPAGGEGFVQVRDGRFVLSESGRQIRFWGTNLTLEGCLPPHDVSERMARRLASLGINCVRMHFMDAAGYPQGLWNTPGWGDFPHRGFQPEALDRLDYLVAQLKAHGVYTDLNLHVARVFGAADGFPPVGEGESVPELGKGVGTFYPPCIEEQKRYARMLLRHVNPYTGNAYAEEPAIAMVEITNENGLLNTYFGSGGALDDLPAAYAEDLTQRWNTWLRRRYPTTDEVRRAWAEGAREGSEENLITMAPSLQVAGTAQATLTAAEGGKVHTVAVRASSDQGWHTQLLWRPLSVEAGRAYALSLRMRANRQEQVAVSANLDHEPWTGIGLYQTVTVKPDWQPYEFTFVATQSDAPDAEGRGGARVSVSELPKAGLLISVADVTLRRTAIRGLAPGEELGRVAWLRKRDWGKRTEALRLDVLRFLQDTEVAYWKGMCDYLHRELGARMPVTGTALGNTTPHIAAQTVDFVDSHAYWQHPEFPGRPWDQDNWIVRNRPMVNSPEGSTIAGLAGFRVFGLPFTVTEYNHPAPQRYAAEGFPLIAACGSFQGWDGVFTYNYAHHTWETDHVDAFFDIKADPVHLALQPACADILRAGRVGLPARVSAAQLTPEEQLRVMLRGQPWDFSPRAYDGGVARLAWQDSLIGVAVGAVPAPPGPPQGGQFRWEVASGERGLVSFQGHGCAGLIGFAAGKTLSAGGLTLTPGSTSLDGFSVVLVNAVDGQELGGEGRYLLTAACRWANRGMGWNKEGNSVGRQWGQGPSLCEGVPLALEVSAGGRAVRLYALNPNGTRREEVPGRAGANGGASFAAGPQNQTLWYELVIGG